MAAIQGSAVMGFQSLERDLTMMRAAVVALALIIPVVPAEAEVSAPENGNGLLRLCTDDNYFQAGLCHGFIAGVLSRDRLQLDANASTRLICDVTRAENGQLKDVVVAYLRAHPADRDRSSSLLVTQALRESFCAK